MSMSSHTNRFLRFDLNISRFVRNINCETVNHYYEHPVHELSKTIKYLFYRKRESEISQYRRKRITTDVYWLSSNINT